MMVLVDGEQENGTKIKLAWKNTKKPTTHLIIALMRFLFTRLISLWFHFLFTVNKYSMKNLMKLKKI